MVGLSSFEPYNPVSPHVRCMSAEWDPCAPDLPRGGPHAVCFAALIAVAAMAESGSSLKWRLYPSWPPPTAPLGTEYMVGAQ